MRKSKQPEYSVVIHHRPEVTEKKSSELDLPTRGVFVGVVREGRQYRAVELLVVDGKKELKKHDPGAWGPTVALACDRLEERAWLLNNEPWTEEELAWKKEPGTL